MAKHTFNSSVKSVIKSIENKQAEIKMAKAEALGKITNSVFKQVGDKYLVKGSYAHKSKSGKSLIYDTPPNADIKVKRTIFFNPKTKFRKIVEVAIFVKGKFVSRSGKFEALVNELSTKVFNKGNNILSGTGVRIEITENSVKMFVDDKSEIFKIETMKRKGSGVLGPIGKCFRSVANMWKGFRTKNQSN